MASKQYGKAALCYAAVLQAIEGVGGAEGGALRQRCALTLAECEIKLGNLYAAVARCSEVIDECPEGPEPTTPLAASPSVSPDVPAPSSSSQRHLTAAERAALRQTLARALYRRAVALQRLDEPRLALLDLRAALACDPADDKVQERVEVVESILLNAPDSGGGGSRTALGAGPDGASGVVSVAAKAAAAEEAEEALREQLQGLVEDSVVNYPRAAFTARQLASIVQARRIGGARRDIGATVRGTGPGAGAGAGLGGMMDMLAGAGGGAGGGLGALGGLGSLLGGLGGGGGGGGGGGVSALMGSLLGGGAAGAAGGSPLGAVGPLLQAFGGVDAATVKVRKLTLKPFLNATRC